MLGSVAERFRAKRGRHLASLLHGLSHPIRILDLGGTETYWEQIGLARQIGGEVVLLNLGPVQSRGTNFSAMVGDACDLSRFSDQSFDLVFSNSVIEHVGDFNRQRQMAREVTRVGRRCYIQTPNRNFPIEPHFLLPLFQFYPAWLQQAALLCCGVSVAEGRLVRRHIDNRGEAAVIASSVRLLTRRELQQLFPSSTIWAERLGPFVKSYVAMQGWDE
jgi:SAM-dependent methyltransferase